MNNITAALAARIDKDLKDMTKRVCIDFDGVIHPYTEGWQGLKPTEEKPVPGIVEELRQLRAEGYHLIVFTTRALTPIGIRLVEGWLDVNSVPYDEVSATKVGAMAYIDDRAVCFQGRARGLAERVINFKPWNAGDILSPEYRFNVGLSLNEIDLIIRGLELSHYNKLQGSRIISYLEGVKRSLL